MSMRKIRSFLLRSERLLGDVDAVRHGRLRHHVKHRIKAKIIHKIMKKLLK